MTDREKVIRAVDSCFDYWLDKNRYLHPLELETVRQLKAEAIVLLKEQEEIRHGEWKWSHGGECSECGYHNSNFNYKYCPMCGATMDA